MILRNDGPQIAGFAESPETRLDFGGTQDHDIAISWSQTLRLTPSSSSAGSWVASQNHDIAK